MFIYENDIPRFFEPFDMPHRGIVVDNFDPKRLGRVKCTIAGLFEETDQTILPWIYPWNPVTTGGKTNSGSFAVPRIGTELVIEFKYKDIYFPFYTGYWQNNLTHQTDFDTNYPNSYGQRDDKGNILKTDMTVGETTYTHHSGFKIVFKNNGDVEIGNAALEYIVKATELKTYINNEIKTVFDNHVHSGVIAGGGNTGAPTTSITPATEAAIASGKHKVGD